MHRGLEPLAAALAAAALACAGAPPVPPPFPGAPAVRGIQLVGAHQLDPGELRAHLATAVTGRWPWSPVHRFDPVTWDEDLRRIRRIYASEGFYRAEVVGSAVERGADGVVLRATVREGPPTHLVELAVDGLAGVPPDVRADALRRVRLRQGRRFREDDWAATKAGIVGVLHEAGYAAAAAGGSVRVDPDAGVARARVVISPGERYRFGPVRLATPAPPGVPPGAIVAEARAALARDSWYRPSSLAAAQARVYRMGAFSAVSVSGAPPDRARHEVPVVVAVRAGPLLTARAGVGVTSSPARDDVHVSGEVVDRHLGGLRTLRVRGRAGWAWIPTLLNRPSTATAPRSGPLALLGIDADQPRLFSIPGLHLYGSTEGELGVQEAYRFLTVRPIAGIALGLGGSALDLSYGLEATRLLETPLVANPAEPIAYGCAGGCTLSFLQLRASWDSRGGGAMHAGHQTVTLRVRAAGGPLGGAHDLVQAILDATATHPLRAGHRTLASAHLTAATVVPLGRERVAPVVARLSGGGDRMRGFAYGHLSPMLVLPGGGRAEVVATGGQGLLEAGLGLTQPLGGSFSMDVFADAGATSVQPFDPGRLLGRLLWAVGAGVGWSTPLGTLRLDLAYRLPVGPALPLAPAPGASPPPVRASSCFGLFGGPQRAGAPEPPCIIQLSFGTSS